MGFVIDNTIGGRRRYPHGGGYMLGTHVLIGIGGGVMIAVTVMAVARSGRSGVSAEDGQGPDEGTGMTTNGTDLRSSRRAGAVRLLDRVRRRAILIAGVVSYFASSSPDGLDSATLKGCQVVETDAGEQLTGECIAQSATDHTMSDSPLADYTLGGKEATGGLAGIIGVVVVLAVGGALFWVIARSRGAKPPTGG